MPLLLDRLRTLRLAVVALLAAALAACEGMAPAGHSADVQALLARGEAYATYLARQDPAELADEEILALGYHERARLGMGSPFRLIDFALRDPDLSPEMRERIAYGVLSQVLRGRTYEVEPVVLDGVRFFAVPRGRPAGAAQLGLIERTIAAAPTPTSGERTVRLGFRLAAADGTLERPPLAVVSHIAALVADRRRAQADARLLLRTAARADVDPLQLLQQWRRELVFQVERAALTPLSVSEEVAVSRDAARTAAALRALALRLMSPTSLVDGAEPSGSEPTPSLLTGLAAERLQTLAERRDYPAQAPVAVAVAINRRAMLERPDLSPDEVEQRRRFLDQAWNEERFVSGLGTLRTRATRMGPYLAVTQLQAASFLRSWSQEEPWYPGDPAPAAKDVTGRFGLAGVEFAPGVPESWRPYYLRMVARGFADIQRVLPTASLRGLTVRIGPLPDESMALAQHDPRTRTLHLPPGTGAGTLAHEVAHDLDWQLARRRYGRRGGYATDHAVKQGRQDRIAMSLSGLAEAIQARSADAAPSAHDVRPAEVFARGVDWFVAAALAREGRTGGYLSSFQDPWLTGYGTTRGPHVGGGAVPALLSILDAIAPVVEETREWALETYGPARTLSPLELASGILSAGDQLPPEQRLGAIADASASSLAALSSASCRFGSAEGMRQLVGAQRELIAETTRAAARGAALAAIRDLAAERLDDGGAQPVRDWLAWRLYGAPEPVDSATLALAPAFDDLLYRASTVHRPDPFGTSNAFAPAGAALCGGNPFAPAAGPRGQRILAPPLHLQVWPAPAVGDPMGDLATATRPMPLALRLQNTPIPGEPGGAPTPRIGAAN